MKKSADNGLLIQLKIRQDQGYTERMNNIRFSGLTQLPLVRIIGNIICLLDHTDIIWGKDDIPSLY